MKILRTKKNIGALLITLFCTALVSVNVSAASDFEKAWADADKLRQDAAAVQHEWTGAKKLLASAKEANEKGDSDKAMKLVAKALEQSKDALAQYEREKEAWKNRVPK
ncbi:MAG: hypothetical protein ACRBHB_07715 [Arenicella sp.]